MVLGTSRTQHVTLELDPQSWPFALGVATDAGCDRLGGSGQPLGQCLLVRDRDGLAPAGVGVEEAQDVADDHRVEHDAASAADAVPVSSPGGRNCPPRARRHGAGTRSGSTADRPERAR